MVSSRRECVEKGTLSDPGVTQKAGRDSVRKTEQPLDPLDVIIQGRKLLDGMFLEKRANVGLIPAD
jgi:hypothetical protein